MSATDRPSLGDVVSAATLAVGVLTAWLYVAGWSYVYDYFDRFRIPLLMVDLPIEHYFVYGGLVARKNLGATVAIGTVLIVFAWMGTWWMAARRRLGPYMPRVARRAAGSTAETRESATLGTHSAIKRHATRTQLATVLVLTIVILFALGRWAGVATAHADYLGERDHDYPAYPRIALVLKRGFIEAVGATLADIPSTDCGRLILVSRDRLFIIRPIRDAPGANLDSFVVPAEQVEAFRITGEYRSCR